MPYPASVVLLQDGLGNVNRQSIVLKSYLQQITNQSLAGPVSRDTMLTALSRISVALSAWNTAAGLTGIAAYAQAQLGGTSDDIPTEFGNMVSATTALQSWIVANFPKDVASGAWLLETSDATGARIPLTFTTSDLAQFRTNAAAVIATIG